MKNTFLLLMLVFSLFGTTVNAAVNPAGPMCMPSRETDIKGPIDHWPWGAEVPFPWRSIQGVWEADVDGCVNYLTFKVVKDDNGERILQSTLIDPATCQVVARGVGFAENRVVTAVMARSGRKGSFEMKVHVFREADLGE